MSRKNETVILLLSLLITLGLVGGGALLFSRFFGKTFTGISNHPSPTTPDNSQTNGKPMSFGEKTFVPGNVLPAKQAGIDAIATGNWSVAVEKLQQALKLNRNDPEALIFLNNAKIGDRKSYAIATVVPMGTDPNGGLEILRGIAQAQTAINQTGGINGVPLKVAIANDNNQEDRAKQVATALVNSPEILAVIGHWASQVTLATAPVYNDGKLVAISPISTSVKLSGISPYIFRTVPSDYIAARALANYMLTQLGRKNAAVFFNPQSAYSQSLKAEFVTAVLLGGGRVSAEFNLSDPSFSPASSLNQAKKLGVEVLMLAANTSTLDKALQVVQVNQKRFQLLGGDDVYTSTTLEVGGEAAVGMVIAIPWDIDTDPKSQFVLQSRQLWGAEVNWRTALAYNATKALIAAMQKSPTREGIQHTLASNDFSTPGAADPVQFLPSGDSNAPVQLVRVVRNAKTSTGNDFVPVRQ
jgi:branched-chain amino acid transport system substrate-binding protein